MVTTCSHSKSPSNLSLASAEHYTLYIYIHIDIDTEQMREATVQDQVLLQALLAKQERTSVGYLTGMIQASLFC